MLMKLTTGTFVCKFAHLMLMKLTTGLNFINILRASFSNENAFLHRCQCSYLVKFFGKNTFVRKMRAVKNVDEIDHCSSLRIMQMLFKVSQLT